MNRNKVLWAAGALLAAFLLGYWPQSRTAAGLRAELSANQEQRQSLETALKLAELRDLIGLTYLESSAKNYGVAREHSTRFFTLASELAAGTSDGSLRALLSEISTERDTITAGLAEGKGAAQPALEALARRVYETIPK